MLTREQVEIMLARAEAATSGDWDYDAGDGLFYVDDFENSSIKNILSVECCIMPSTEDAEFIINARRDVIALAREVFRLRDKIKDTWEWIVMNA